MYEIYIIYSRYVYFWFIHSWSFTPRNFVRVQVFPSSFGGKNYASSSARATKPTLLATKPTLFTLPDAVARATCPMVTRSDRVVEGFPPQRVVEGFPPGL